MDINNNIRSIIKEAGYKENLANILCNLLRYMEKKQWWGACHASCSALYVAVSELGYKPKLCIGELLGNNLYFDHSWIELDDKVIDLSISMTLQNGLPVSDPIVLGKSVRTGNLPELIYGFPGRGIEGDALIVRNIPFVDYMDMYPDEKNGSVKKFV